MRSPGMERSGTQSQAGFTGRFRIRLAGRIDQVWIRALDANPVYRAELVVAKSISLPRDPVPAMGAALVEPPGEDFESAETGAGSARESVATAGSSEAQEQHRDIAPALDGQRVMLIWHGQRTVPGVQAGTLLRCSGMLSQYSGELRIYNPRYEIVPEYTAERTVYGR